MKPLKWQMAAKTEASMSSTIKRPPLGTQIYATDTLRRCCIKTEAGVKKEWFKRGELTDSAKPVQGIYIGWRTYSNGILEYCVNADYKALAWFEVWLIVPNERENPVPVLPNMVGNC